MISYSQGAQDRREAEARWNSAVNAANAALDAAHREKVIREIKLFATVFAAVAVTLIGLGF